MAPISSATSPVSCSSPPFFGPPIAEFNSLWYRLYIYETVKAGPPSLFVPRGTVLIVLPSIFQNFESIYMAQPNQPPTIIPCNQSIHLINDLLRHSCIFLQGNKKIDQLFSKLTTEHNLSKGFGVLTLIKFEKQRSLKRQNTLSEYSYDFDESNSSVYQPPISGLPEGYRNIDQSFYYESTDAITQANAKETILDNKYDWLPFEIVHGIPLFNDTLNDCICEKISNLNLFSHQNTQEYISENRKIILKLMDFIIKYGGKRSETIQKAVTDPKNKRYTYLPTKPRFKLVHTL
ncbi:hypothetical protein RF11_07133 [Thelohanellus kitauei]|uniref:FAM91 C-terminal domain-containing protein n=1 Tax=Thelohanellus kitauei TaxID=669202 RepID=A0A0C2M3F5_THEKT|nr:hypothetical protein RF11_07133 [Thelohanellus kitauei]